ncbi:MAG: hypothetical protein U5J82_09090 [Desulfobacterales bacterium]|nr:hypothetical protein [Desulfobacterales bacterium]
MQPVTDLQSRRISRDVFEGLLQADPEVGTFLTEIVADPFGVRGVAPPYNIPAREVKHALFPAPAGMN